jgi:hypothetical protein
MANIFKRTIDNLFLRYGSQEVFNEHLSKAIGDKFGKQPVKGKTYDPLNMSLLGGMDYRERTGIAVLSYKALKDIANKNALIAAIINTRVNQIATFGRRAAVQQQISGNKSLGFKLLMKDKPESKMNRFEIKEQEKLEKYIDRCGYSNNFASSLGRPRPRFSQFLRLFVNDRLTYDQVCFEKISNRKAEPAEFFAVDASTIRFKKYTDTKKRYSKNDILYLQVLNGQIVTEYTAKELAMCQCNTSTDIESNGYGQSEAEKLVSIITAQMNAETYNKKFFTQGLGVQGILNFVTKDGRMDEVVMKEFRQEFIASARGLANAWKTPVTNADKIDWINLKPSNRDMEFKEWMNYLIKVTCAVYQIAPEEINFYFGKDGGNAIFESGQEQKLKYSKDKGIRPILNFTEDEINSNIIDEINPDFMLCFVGLDYKDDKELIENRVKEGGAYKTVDECRAEAGLDELGEDKGGSDILNSIYAQIKMQQAMSDQMSQQSGEENSDEEDDGSQFDFKENK